jgi:phosphoribosylformylglycinamidine synthase
VIVRLREGLLDPQGKAIEESLPHLGWTNVSGVRVGKHIEFDLEADDAEAASRQAQEMGDKLLSNPVIESIDLEWKMADLPDGRIAIAADTWRAIGSRPGETGGGTRG